MSLRDQTVQEIDRLSPVDLAKVYNIIYAMKGTGVASEKKQNSAYLNARKILSRCTVSLSQEIIDQREDRI
jgi:hypothetical protein